MRSTTGIRTRGVPPLRWLLSVGDGPAAAQPPQSRIHADPHTKPNGSIVLVQSITSTNSSFSGVYCAFLPYVFRPRTVFSVLASSKAVSPNVHGNVLLWDARNVPNPGTSISTFLPPQVLSPRCPFCLTAGAAVRVCSASG